MHGDSQNLNEDDTFNRLKRKPFEEVIYDMTHYGESISGVYRFVVAKVAEGHMHPRDDWDEHCGGWTWKDFHVECVKRHMEAYTPDNPDFPVLRKG